MWKKDIVVELNAAIVFLTILGLFTASCGSRSVDFANLSVDDLTSNGFYAYVLPSEKTNSLGWEQTISMNGFDTHCSQEDTIQRSNPVLVVYKDGSQQSPFAIEIVPFYVAWDSTQEINQVSLDLSWIPQGRGEYYFTESGGIVLKFKDARDMEVVIHSWKNKADITDLTELISQLQYVGAVSTDNSNPWENACK